MTCELESPIPGFSIPFSGNRRGKRIMNLSHLRSFIAIVEAGSINRAATMTGIPSTTLSRHLRELDDELGVTLIERTTHRSTVTPWGNEFYGHALDVLSSFDDACDAIQNLKAHPAGSLSILAPSAFGRRIVAPMLVSFREAYPDITVSLSLDNRGPDLNDIGADIAFRIGEAPVGSERFDVIGIADFQLVASPRYLETRPKISAPEDLANHAFVSVSVNSAPETWSFSAGDDRRTVHLTPVINMYDPTGVRELVSQGAGIGIIAEIFCDREIRSGELVRIIPGWQISTQQHYGMAHRRSLTKSPRVRAFLDHARSALADHFTDPNGTQP